MTETISTSLHETRHYNPSLEFQSNANVTVAAYEKLKCQSSVDPVVFWEKQAEDLKWQKKWHTALEWKLPFAKWFKGGLINVAENCLDRHLGTGTEDKNAIVWEGESGEIRKLTYGQLHKKVCSLTEVLRRLGVKKGDRVAIYMPLVPEAVMAMLACARIGAIHSVIFAGFSAESIRGRINDAKCNLVITADGGFRNGKVLELKNKVDDALSGNACPSVTRVLVLKRANNEVSFETSRDVWWHDALKDIDENVAQTKPEGFESDHPLFILYTSGTTGKPKGIFHSSGGYLTQVSKTTNWVFDLKPSDLYWCTADIGWITGHSYVVYGPLAEGASVFLYEGAPLFPEPDRFWKMIERHKISILYTAPTAIRTFMKKGDSFIEKHDLSSLRVLGTVGEPINPEAWVWYHQKIGHGKCPIVDTWWQTETGSILLSPLPGVDACVPGTATKPLPGIDLDVVDEKGKSLTDGTGGFLVARKPWPSMMLGIWKDEKRYKETYWSQIEGCYLAGDGARVDEEGNFWIMGRIDDVVNVSGHRIGTMEVESVLVAHPVVAEAAVVARPDEVTGQALVAYVTLKEGIDVGANSTAELKASVQKEIGSFAKPAEIQYTKSLPKTRSGKIMRRLLRELATKGRVVSDTTTLEDASVLEEIAAKV